MNTFYSGFATELIKLAQGADFGSLDKELARKGFGGPKLQQPKPSTQTPVKPVKPPKPESQAQAEEKEFSVQTQRGPAAQKQLQQGMAEQRKRDEAFKKQKAADQAAIEERRRRHYQPREY